MRLNVAITFALLVVGLLSGCTHYRAEILQNERFDDLKNLYIAYTDKPTATNIDELIQILAARGKKLNNPFRKDPTKPCYQLVIVSNQADVGPDTILIEETNTIGHLMYVLYRDGSVAALPRN